MQLHASGTTTRQDHTDQRIEQLGLPPERWIGLDFGCGQVTRIDVESWGTVLKWFNR